MDSHSLLQATDPARIKLLAISFAYPPLAYPQSIQVARLLKYLKASTVLLCADEAEMSKDPTLEPDAEARLEKCLRVPFKVSGRQKLINRLSHRFYRPIWNYQNMVPDKYGAWKTAALKEVANSMRLEPLAPDVLVTFGQPFTDHLIGLELKRRYGLPWLAHFSDPWVDNMFNRYDKRVRQYNLALEREVVEMADVLVFTSRETIDLMLEKYPAEWKDKARVLPHSFDPTLFKERGAAEAAAAGRNSTMTVRYVGNFYGQRTPAPLIKTLRLMLDADRDAFADVRFELIGECPAESFRTSGGDSLPPGLLTIHPPVGYSESLRLMSQADGLLVIDAPAEASVFLPSKLVDYIGAGRPVLGLTPKGTSDELIRQLGGITADPSDPDAMRGALEGFLSLLRSRRLTKDVEAWGTAEVRRRYEALRVADSFEEMLKQMLFK